MMKKQKVTEEIRYYKEEGESGGKEQLDGRDKGGGYYNKRSENIVMMSSALKIKII